MKKKSGWTRRNPAFIVWLTFHLLLFLAVGGAVWLGKPLTLSASWLELLPPNREAPTVEVEKIIAERAAREVVIFSQSADFNTARDAALALHKKLTAPLLTNVTLAAEPMAALTEFVYRYRYRLLSPPYSDADELATTGLAGIFGAWHLTPLDHLDTDPFDLTERHVKKFAQTLLGAGGAFAPRDDVLAAKKDGVWYVPISGALTPVAADATGVEKIYAAAATVQNEFSAVTFGFSGLPFHTAGSAGAVKREITLLSFFSLSAVAVLLWIVFRSPGPVLLTSVSLVLALAAALSVAFLFCPQLHALTLVFGTTVIGIGVDYSLHFFARAPTRRVRGLTASFLSTIVCYLLLWLAPFDLLRQLAVFSLGGLTSSFLTTLVLPLIWRRRWQWREIAKSGGIDINIGRQTRRYAAIIFIVGIGGLFAFELPSMRWGNDLTALYSPPPLLRDSEKIAAELFGRGSGYFLISGDDAETVLQREESLIQEMPSAMAVSRFLPSLARQAQSYATAKNLLPLAKNQFAALGLPATAETAFYTDFTANATAELTPENFPTVAPSALAALFNHLWLGNIDGRFGGKFYSVVLPAADNRVGKTADGVRFVNPPAAIARELDNLTRRLGEYLLLMVALSGIVVALFYRRRAAARLWLATISALMATVALLTVWQLPLNFFTAAGLLLVCGLGFDYVIYLTANRGDRVTRLAVILSFLTTELSFGALAFSSFMPVKLLGVTVAVGLAAAVTAAFLFAGNGTPSNQVEKKCRRI